MKAVVLAGPRRVELVDLPEPEIQPGSVVVEIDRAGIGGSDVEAFIRGEVPAPAWFGHEWVGRIVAVAPGLADRFEGERVIGAAPPACGLCPPCRAGLAPHCNLVLEMIVGSDRLASAHGAFAERIRVDGRRVHRVPDGIDDDAAAVAESASVAAHAVTRGPVTVGDLVVVVGAGTIGLLVAELARIAGASRVVAVDPQSVRQELACDLGADAAFAPGEEVASWLARTGHRLGADVVFDCVGADGALTSAIELVRRGGTVVAVGISSEVRPTLPAALIEREVTVRASLGYGVSDVRRVLELMADDRLRVDRVCEPEPVGLTDVPAVLAGLADQRGRSRVLVAPSGPFSTP